jgi:1,2-dihydroxy-3-keto-5-methylthiopentene dioxygenase
MTTLSVYQQANPELPNKVLTHVEDIASTLAEVGVRFAHCPTAQVRDVDSRAEVLLRSYQTQITQFMNETGLLVVDVVDFAQHPQQAESRAALLHERSHGDEQLYWCVAGRALWALHIGEQVFEVLFERGDLIVLPATSKHWLDIGEQADFVAIHLCASADALAAVTGDPISEGFSRLEAWM